MLAWAKPAHAETYNTCAGFITSVPAVITTQGTWCLKQDLSTAMTTGSAITINANNVTIDCNDYKLGDLAAGLGTATAGIYAANRLNLTVRHCNIRGFLRGVFFTGSNGGGFAIEDNRFDGNTSFGLQVEGDGSVIQRNRVFDTGGANFLSEAYGMYTTGSVEILDNTVSGVVATSGTNGNAYGIYADTNPESSISGNRVLRLVKAGTGATRGIYSLGSDHIAMHNNDVFGDSSANSIGLRCTSSSGSAKDNVVSGFLAGISNCSNDGGNAVHP